MSSADGSPNRPWRLSQQLKGHTSDVKAVHCAVVKSKDEGKQTRQVILTVSRDSTARVWSRDLERKGAWEQGPTLEGGGRYLNAVVLVPRRDDQEEDLVLIAGLDGLIRSFPLPFDSLLQPGRITEPMQIIEEHYGNVTSLRYFDELLLSASWDTTARSYRRDRKGKWHRLHLLKGHESAVWGIEVLDAKEGAERYLTASADLFVRLFEANECKVVWEGHRDVVRDLKLLNRGQASQEQLFASSSNDAFILINSLSPTRRPPNIPTNGGPPLLTLEGHTSIVYSLALLSTEPSSAYQLLVSSSEDGTVRLWDTILPHNNEENATPRRLVDTIPHPVTTVWCVDSLPHSGDIVSGSEDGVVRVFTQRPKGEGDGEEVTQAELDEYEAGCAEVAMKTGRLGSRGQVVAVECNESLQSIATQQIHPVDGKTYDFLLPIDVSDDQPHLILGFNRGDNPRRAAKDLIAQHLLPESYEEEIVAFIRQVSGV